jgi:hypothetical protein
MPLHGPRCPKQPMCTHQPSHPLGPTHPNLGVLLMSTPQPLWCTPSLGCFCPMLHLMLGKAPWHVHMPKVPTFPTSATLGCWSNPKFCLLEDLGEGLTPSSPKTLHQLSNLRQGDHPQCLSVALRTYWCIQNLNSFRNSIHPHNNIKPRQDHPSPCCTMKSSKNKVIHRNFTPLSTS